MSAVNYQESLDSISQRMQNIECPIGQKCVLDAINLCENIYAENESLKKQIQAHKDAINRLKGEQGTPDFGQRGSNKKKIESTENERREAEKIGGDKITNGYKLGKSAIEKLLEQDLPTDALEELKNLKSNYDDKNEFLSDVKLMIGEDCFNKYHDKILKHATYRKRCRASKVDKIVVTNEIFCPVEKDGLPEDAYRIEDSEKIVQDMIITPDNTLMALP